MLVRFGCVGYEVFRRWFLVIRGFRERLSLKRCLSNGFGVSVLGLESEWAMVVL